MNKLLKVVSVSFCLLFSINIALAQKTKSKAKAAQKTVAQTKVDLGKLEFNTYTNDFFSLKIEFPFGWLVGDNGLEKQLYAIQRQGIKTKDPKQQASMNQAMDRVTGLLGGYKALPGSVAENSSLRISVENLSAMPNVKTSEEYLKILLNTIKQTTLPAGFNYSEIKSETIDGIPVNYVQTSFGSNQTRSYVIIRKGFAVLIKIESYGQEDFETLHKVLTDADLDYKK